ncbi:MAG: hypothetical protein HFJ55_00205 [Clostridia bacterium]|nr:hypothetical protein [Clostridia bacterium]
MERNRGITLIALAITIIIMIIIASVSIYVGNSNTKDAIENKQLAEIRMVYQAVLEVYTKYQMTQNKNLLIGEVVPYETVENLLKEINEEPKIQRVILNQENQEDAENDGTSSVTVIALEYCRLNADNLNKLGITEADEDVTYIVNYSTGEVMNETTIKTTSGKHLYLYFPEQTKK